METKRKKRIKKVLHNVFSSPLVLGDRNLEENSLKRPLNYCLYNTAVSDCSSIHTPKLKEVIYFVDEICLEHFSKTVYLPLSSYYPLHIFSFSI